jgi:hypothetical protein
MIAFPTDLVNSFARGYDRLVLSRLRSDRGGAFTLRLEVNALMLRLRDSANALPQPERRRTLFVQTVYSNLSYPL